jgi:hypothetical protein
MRGRHAARKSLGYSDWDDENEMHKAGEFLATVESTGMLGTPNPHLNWLSYTWEQLIEMYEQAEAARDKPHMSAIYEQLTLRLEPYGSVPASGGGPAPEWLRVPALGMPDRVIPAKPSHLHWSPDQPRDESGRFARKALPPDRVCSGCGIEESSPIGAGPFENGFCRFCAQIDRRFPIANRTAIETAFARVGTPMVHYRTPARKFDLSLVFLIAVLAGLMIWMVTT